MAKDYNFVVKITTACPGNCKSCTSRRSNFKNKNKQNIIFDLDVFESICKNIVKLGGSYICLSGGEPTLISNLEDFISVAHKYNLATRINTNGWGVTEERMVNFLKLGLDQVVLSVYGTDEDIVAKTRGNKMLYEKSQNALTVLKRLKKEYNFIFIVQTIILKDNYKNLPDIFLAAIDAGADLFWPSYLEDAYFLPDIRMNEEDIKEFKNVVIPKMIDIVELKIKSDVQCKKIISILQQYYVKEYDNFEYHKDKNKCKIIGKHLTFYPGGTVDPCPGHEYFSSESQKNFNEIGIDYLISDENLNNNTNISFDYCKYCPQGEHLGISLREVELDEHSGKDILLKK